MASTAGARPPAARGADRTEARGDAMGEVVYRPRVAILRQRGPDRVATLPAGEEVAFGVHGEVAAHYGVDPDASSPTSTTIDYLVAAAGG
jgi:hypothetical protein